MEKAGICVICKKKIANHTCGLCGRHVCEDDYDSKRGLCSLCKKGRIMERANE